MEVQERMSAWLEKAKSRTGESSEDPVKIAGAEKLLKLARCLAMLVKAHDSLHKSAGQLAEYFYEEKCEILRSKDEALETEARARADEMQAKVIEIRTKVMEETQDDELMIASMNDALRMYQEKIQAPDSELATFKGIVDKAEATLKEHSKKMASAQKRIERYTASIERERKRKNNHATNFSRKKSSVSSSESFVNDKKDTQPVDVMSKGQMQLNSFEHKNMRKFIKIIASDNSIDTRVLSGQGLTPFLPHEEAKAHGPESEAASLKKDGNLGSNGVSANLIALQLPAYSTEFEYDEGMPDPGKFDTSKSPWTRQQKMPPAPSWIPPELVDIEIGLAKAQRSFSSQLRVKFIHIRALKKVQVELYSGSEIVSDLGKISEDYLEKCNALLNDKGVRIG